MQQPSLLSAGSVSSSANSPGKAPIGKCRWESEPSAQTGVVTIVVGDAAKTSFENYKLLKHTFTAVPRLGDEAWQEPTNIFVRKGALWFFVNLITTNDSAQSAEPLRTDAGLILERLA